MFEPGPGEIGSVRLCICDADALKDVIRECKKLIREKRVVLYYIEHDCAEVWIMEDDTEARKEVIRKTT